MLQNPTPENVKEHQELRKIASKKLKSVKREYEKQRRSSIEEYRKNPRLFFRNYRSFMKGFKAITCIVKDANGCLIVEELNIVEQFRNHFKE